MKTIRLFLLFTSVILSAQLFPQMEITPHQQRISLEKAIQDFGLVRAMHNQIDPSIIQTREKIIMTHVKYKDINYIVYGSLDLWTIFLTMDPEASPVRTTALL